MEKDPTIGLFTGQEKALVKFIKKIVKKTKKKKGLYLVMTPKQYKTIIKHSKPFSF